jgi:hypothetical protein
MPAFWLRRSVVLLLSPIGLLLISVTRLLIISDYNTTTATTIASSGGYVNTLLGTVIPLVPIFLPYFAIFLLIFKRFVLSGLTFGAALLISPTRLAPLTALDALKKDWVHVVAIFRAHLFLSIVLVLALLILDTTAFRITFGRLGMTTLTLALLATAFLIPYVLYVYPYPHASSYYAQFMRQPWLPAEQITAKSGYSVLGYVLSEDSNWVTVLRASARTIEYIPANDVIRRSVCETEPESPGNAQSPLIPLLDTKAARLPSCIKSGSPNQANAGARLQADRWTATAAATSSTRFRSIPALTGLKLCAAGEVSVSISTELGGAPAGFRIEIDQRHVMAGPVRFFPMGARDSSAFTFVRDLTSFHGSDLHSLDVQWRSPFGLITRMERATIHVQYDRASGNCRDGAR